MAVPVPTTFDEITLDWFHAAIAEGRQLDAEFSSIDVVPMDESKGLVGDLASIRATYARGTGPARFVIKLPAANTDSRAIGEMLNAYAREVAFYRHVAPAAPGARLPAFFYGGDDPESRRWALILEEIEPDPYDPVAGATLQQAGVALDALADFHAHWWESPQQFEWMPGFKTSGVGGLQPLWLRNLPVFVERYRDSLPRPTAEWVIDFAPQLSNWSAQAATEPLTMVHSDYRVDNMIFSGGDSGQVTVTMIDWQTAMWAPAAMDVSCFLTTSLSIENRRQHETTLIDRYLQRLARAQVPGTASLDHDWFARSYDENILWWMGQFGNNLAHLSPPNETVQAALTTMIERVYTAGLDRNVGRLL